jgi:gluconate 2-dehydrogenase gamma chain
MAKINECECSSDQSSADRRKFLELVGVAGAAAGALPFSGTASAADTPPRHTTHKRPAATVGSRIASAGYQFFNTEESAFVEAAVDVLIPADAVGPGASALGVAGYIDRQLVGGYGKGDRLYLEGPFGEGTPQQGYQLPMTPAELIRAGISDVNDFARRKHTQSFDLLSAVDRAEVMAELDGNKVDLPTVPTATFFNLLLQLTIEGYFADPMYEGNKNKAAWKMIGFPGATAMYADKIEPFRNKLYATEPMGIQDLI